MTTEQVASYLAPKLSEILDGYVVIGFIAGSNQPVHIWCHNHDPKTAMALQQIADNLQAEQEGFAPMQLHEGGEEDEK